MACNSESKIVSDSLTWGIAISRKINVKVWCLWPRLITLTETLIILDITKSYAIILLLIVNIIIFIIIIFIIIIIIITAIIYFSIQAARSL